MASNTGYTSLEGADKSLLPKVRLNIAILFLGTRGDLQPSLAIAKLLHYQHGHRVRIATHPAYRVAIEAEGIEFYSIGDKTDPKILIQRRLLEFKEMKAMIPTIIAEFKEMGERWFGACVDAPEGLSDGKAPSGFVADAVIATMQSYAHTSIAARMGVPLHMLGTNPRTSSKYLPHSQAVSFAKGEGKFSNLFSHWIQDLLFHHTIKTMFNELRVNELGLEPFAPAWQLSQFNRMRIPYSYIWSPAFLPKPPDWGDHIDISGFIFHDEPDYAPPADLEAFLNTSETPPIYIGFGSMVFPDPVKFFKEVLGGIEKAGVRVILSRGWSSIGDDFGQQLQNVYIIDEAPHSWLFPRVAAVVCHGGGGTTARALKCGKPVLIIPVQGDQQFWGYRVFKAGCGPEPTFNYKQITADLFAERLKDLSRPEYAIAAAGLAMRINAEPPGEGKFVESALRTLTVYDHAGRCDVYPERPAVWKNKLNGAKLSAVGAHVLIKEKKIAQVDLDPLNLVKWPDLVSPGDPINGLFKGLNNVFVNFANDFKKIGSGAAGQGLLHLPLHLLRAPLIIIVAIIFGLYNLLDFALYELGSPFEPKLFASNPRLYSYPQMLVFLLLGPFVELASIITQPPKYARQRRIPRAIGEVPLALVRVLVALLTVLVGFFALSLRALDLAFAKMMGERPKGDVVAAARIRQGGIEAETLAVEAVEQGLSLHESIVRSWDEKFGSSLVRA